ncbi:enoyl-CoA hydratase/isomerase family protein [Leucobacter sp. CSA1]|uniref:Enoyl-CoA hydratase/isomerase family protein n=1 Tax=Leucobacter chromiisoli TaxID=2796471 RepID=A0A934UV31_9MICO|nr:enoyl-CoA hydratase/isomerase family protein [Leucobacter chromiisoli]MBK0418803.1 enoyl-CoA hydratase/isomerase family protein [Leucobacter chromiisoli]
MTGKIRVEIDDEAIATLTIDNPRKRNAWTEQMRDELIQAVTELSAAPPDTCRAIVLTGEGPDAFCAGEDLSVAIEFTPENAGVDQYRDLFSLIRRAPKPIIAAIRGVAAGSGMQLALCADYRVSHPDVRFGQPEVRTGQASVTGSWLLAQSVGIAKMRSLVLSGELVRGSEAWRLGLVDLLTDSDAVHSTARTVALRLSEAPIEAYAATKRAICDMEEQSFQAAFDIANETHAWVASTDAAQRGISKFFESRPSRVK